MELISKSLPLSAIKEHHISGYLYKKTADSHFSSDWKSQYHCNSIIKSELEDLSQLFSQQNIKVCLLKGFSLMGDIYEDWGSRFASDVDILVNSKQLDTAKLILNLAGYKELEAKKWKGDDFKSLFTKTVGKIEITVEIHTRLFWHIDSPFENRLRPSQQINGYYVLAPELQLVHLCGHLGFQHTFLKLFWFIDICEYLKKYRAEIDWQNLWQLSLNYKLFKSVYMPLYLCHKMRLINLRRALNIAPKKYFLSLTILEKLLTPEFLLKPKSKYWRYLLVKNLIKDSFLDNISYNKHWLLHKILS